jgi:type IV pilus assembly protein PilM
MSFLKNIFGSKAGIGGIDIGTSLIKIVQLSKTGSDKIELTKVAVGPTPSMAIKDGSIVDSTQISQAIKQLLESNRMVFSKVFSSVSGQKVVMRPINMARMSEKDMQNAIKFEAERYVPYPIADATIRGKILRKDIEGDENNMEVLLASAPNEMVEKVSDTLKNAGLVVGAIDLEPFAILRTIYSSIDQETFNETIALINLGASTSSINIYKGGTLRHNRTINLAGNNFTRAIAQSLNLSFDEAEKIKIEKGVIRLEKDSTPVAPTTMRIFNVIVPVLQDLKVEIQRSFDYYRSRYRGESVDLMILSGGTSRFKNLDGYLASEMGVTCEISNPFNNIPVKSSEIMTVDEFNQLSPSLVVSLGLALSEYLN